MATYHYPNKPHVQPNFGLCLHKNSSICTIIRDITYLVHLAWKPSRKIPHNAFVNALPLSYCRGTSHDILVTNRGQVRTEANRLRKMTMQVTSWQGLPARDCKYVHFGGNLGFRSYLSYPNVSFAQCTVLCTDVTFPDDLVAFAHKSHMHMSRLHAQPWQHGILHWLGVKTAGVTHCKQNGYVSHAQKMTISIIIL